MTLQLARKMTPAVDHNPEDLVFIRPSYIWNAASARPLIGKTIWVKVGYGYHAWPVRGGRVVRRGAVLLAPLEALTITGVLQQSWPGGGGIFLTWKDGSGTRAAKIGTGSGDNASMRFDNMFLLDDPHQLYSFWTPAMWDTIGHHQVVKGMDEAQVNFSLGTAQIENDDGDSQTYFFPRDHDPIEVTLVKHKVASFRKPQP